MTTITTPRDLLEQALEALEVCYSTEYDGAKIYAAKLALRAELAKPVERVEPIALDQFRAIAHRTATTYRHRSDPEKSSYAFVDGSSLDDFWRKVCEAIQPTSAWHDAPTRAGLWVRNRHEGIGVYSISEPSIKILKWSAARWYGPIPEDIAKAEERTE